MFWLQKRKGELKKCENSLIELKICPFSLSQIPLLVDGITIVFFFGKTDCGGKEILNKVGWLYVLKFNEAWDSRYSGIFFSDPINWRKMLHSETSTYF